MGKLGPKAGKSARPTGSGRNTSVKGARQPPKASTQKSKRHATSERPKASRKNKEKDLEEEAFENPKPAPIKMPAMQGIGLAPKLMFGIALVTASVTLVVGYSLASTMRENVRNEIIKSGIDGVKLLGGFGRVIVAAASDGKSFKTKGEFSDATLKATANMDVLSKLEHSPPGMSSSIQNAILTLKGDLLKGKEDYLWSILPPEDLTISSGKRITGVDKLNIAVHSGTVRKGSEESSVFIFLEEFSLDGSWNGTGDSSYLPTHGVARLILSATKVKESMDEVFVKTMIVLGLAVLASLVIAFFVARGITSPILQLVRDMFIVSKGDLDHQTKASSSDEIGYLSTTFNQLTHSLKVAHEAEIEKEKLEHDMQVGREIQQTLLPKTLYKIPHYDIDAFYQSAKEVGGDYYDLIPVDKTHLGVVVADVSGKGIQGAMIMTIMRTIMNIAAVGNLSSKGCLARTNRFLAGRIKRGMFVTTFYAILDCKKSTLKFSSAGHNPMVIYRAKTKSIELLNPTGIAVGFDKGPLFERTIKEEDTLLEPGDRFVLYTDGVVESMNEDREEFTDKRFQDFVLEHATEDSKSFVRKLVAEVQSHQGKAPQHDDITIVTFLRQK